MSFSRKCFKDFFSKLLLLFKVYSSLKVFCRKILLLTQASHETLAELLQICLLGLWVTVDTTVVKVQILIQWNAVRALDTAELGDEGCPCSWESKVLHLFKKAATVSRRLLLTILLLQEIRHP